MLRGKGSVGLFRRARWQPFRKAGTTTKPRKLLCACVLLLGFSGLGVSVPVARGHNDHGFRGQGVEAQAANQGGGWSGRGPGGGGPPGHLDRATRLQLGGGWGGGPGGGGPPGQDGRGAFGQDGGGPPGQRGGARGRGPDGQGPPGHRLGAGGEAGPQNQGSPTQLSPNGARSTEVASAGVLAAAAAAPQSHHGHGRGPGGQGPPGQLRKEQGGFGRGPGGQGPPGQLRKETPALAVPSAVAAAVAPPSTVATAAAANGRGGAAPAPVAPAASAPPAPAAAAPASAPVPVTRTPPVSIGRPSSRRRAPAGRTRSSVASRGAATGAPTALTPAGLATPLASGLTAGGATATHTTPITGALAPGTATLTPATATARRTTGAARTARGRAAAGHQRINLRRILPAIGFPFPTVIDRFIQVIPVGVWIALALALALAALAGVAAFRSRRQVRLQAGYVAAASAAALTDPLTGVLNRRGFLEAAERELDRAQRYGHPLALAFVDIRGLKAVNDTEGHLAGDRLLRRVSLLLTESARTHDLVGRIGGDELAVLLAEQSAEGAAAMTQRVRSQVPAHRAGLGLATAWDVTIGTAVYPEDGESLEQLLEVADRRLYRQRGIDLTR